MTGDQERKFVDFSQTRLLKEIVYNQISRGALFPISLLCEYVASGTRVLNVGCGPGEKAIEQAKDNFVVTGVDINSSAITQANDLVSQEVFESAPQFIVGDVTNLALVEKLGGRQFSAIVAEALYCNLIGKDSELATEVFSKLLVPGGIVCIADCLRADDPNAEKLIKEDVYACVSDRVFGELYDSWRKGWLWRYKQNVILGDWLQEEDLVDGTFVVLPPNRRILDMLEDSILPSDHLLAPFVQNLPLENVDVKMFEYGQTELLYELVKLGWVERMARHWGRDEILGLFDRHGFKNQYWKDTLWRSRTGAYLLGMTAVFELQEVA